MDIIQQNKKTYDAIAEKFDGTRRYPWRFFELFTPYLKDKNSFLDLGCGNGKAIIYLKSFKDKFEYLGVDISEELIKISRKNNPKYKFQIADIANYKSRKKYDAILVFASMYHLPPELHKTFMRNLYDSLEENGIAIITNWNLEKHKEKELHIPWKEKKPYVYRYCYNFSMQELKDLAKNANFEILDNFFTSNKEKSRSEDDKFNLCLVLEKLSRQ